MIDHMDDFDEATAFEWSEGSGYEYDDGPSLSRMAVMYDTGKACGECFAEFVAPNNEPSSCKFCHNHGSELPLSKHEELNREAHKAVARRRRKARKAKESK